MNEQIILKSRPKGKPELKDFEFQEFEEKNSQDLVLETKYISVDPYLRGRMRDEKSYIEPFKVGEPLESMVVAEVTDSKIEDFKKGDHVIGMLDWKKKQHHSGKDLRKIDPNMAPASAYLGVLGLTGLTAYLALDKIGKLKKGETLLVSGAAGAVGSVVGQIGKIKGCRVVGIAGSDEKIEHIQKKFGFDAGINYKTTKNMKDAIKKTCPDGVNVYFDNVGGEILDAALQNINKAARIINCGAISIYNETEVPTGPRPEGILIKKSALMQGFLVRDHMEDYQKAISDLAGWLKSGDLKYDETIVEGFDKTPQAFIDIFDGKNLGKMVVKV
ncbi:NADP-dependent oxidoreductase [Christiangramia sp. SM2212]|uniref:NADP-dependent oxidoreductase n=1 Tax=Christiangramia sediminicola TaxID=3073267 RepID=A0ABU1EQC7_9FLAO|nr:NADP-dependent oxidoreductase [Christiangramia sp. SM2212]MDR5590184.1 NADP-dependent oxidoreductase [Christiangramia sp. SM2212]